jgi:non-specific serine/threonine protein kinase
VTAPYAAELQLAPRLSPQGQLSLFSDPDAPSLPAELAERLQAAFARGAGDGLLQLGAGEIGQALPPSLAYWREFAGQFVAALCTRAEPGPADSPPPPLPPPTPETLQGLVAAVPPMLGAEYLDVDLLQALWRKLDAVVQRELARPKASLQDLLQRYHPSWHLVGRVNFHLAENRQDPERPCAFMATYTHALTSQGSARHLPLGQAFREYAGAVNKAQLLALLLPVQRAAEHCDWLRELVDSGELFHPLRWSAAEACRLLADVPNLERAGVVVRFRWYRVPFSSMAAPSSRVSSAWSDSPPLR